MKLLIPLFLVFVSSISRAQDSIQLTRSTWYGGVCCNTGDNFYLKIPKSVTRKGVDSLWIFIPEARIHISSKLFSKEHPDQLTFGWTIYSEDESYKSAQGKSYHGIEETDVVASSTRTQPENVTVFLSNGKQKQIPVIYKTESVAYP